MRRTLVVAAVAAVAVTGGVFASPVSAAPRTDAGPFHAACGTSGPNLENRVEADAPAGDAVNQRTGSSTSCGIAGVLQPTDDALYHCYTRGNDGYLWTYLRNQRTGVRGWVRDDLLDINPNGVDRGSNRWCQF